MEKNRKSLALVSAGLVAGLALGSLGIASAATSSSATTTGPSAPSTATPDGRGMRGPGGPDGIGHGMGGGGDIGEAVAKLTGLTEAEVRTQREAGKTFGAIAQAKGVTTDQVVAETVRLETAELDALVKAGTITAARKTEVLSGIDARITAELTRTGQPGGPGGHHGAGFGRGGDLVNVVASLTGTSESDVRTARESGKSFATIAKANGVTTDQVVAEVTERVTAELDAAVKAGKLTAAGETQILAGFKAHIGTELTETALRGPGGPGGPGHGPGLGEPTSTVAPTASTSAAN